MAGPWEKYATEAPADGPWTKYAGAAAAEPAAAGGDPSAAVGRALINGIPIVGPAILSGVNKGAAAVRSIQSGKPYDEELRNVEQFSDATAAANPGATVAGEIGGAVVGTLPLVAAAPAAFGVTGASMGARVAAGAASGGALGAADSGARGRDPLLGGGIGLLAGGAAPPLAAGASKLVGAITGRTGGPERLLNRAMQSDGITPEVAAQQLAEMGPAATIADLGPNLQRQAGALAATPGEAQQVVRNAIAQRQAGAGARTTEATDAALGRPVDALATMDELISQRREIARPLYEAAYAKPLPPDPRILNVLKTPAGQKAIGEARTLAANEGVELGMDVRSIDLIKRSMDDMVRGAQRGGAGNEARVLGNLRDALVRATDEAVPEFAKARSAFADQTALQEAFQAGQDVFGKAMTPGQLARTMKGMSEGEKELLQSGARSALADIMGTARNDALKARQVFDQGYNKEKLSLLIGKQEADKLVGSLADEAAFTRTRDVVTGNSETAARTAASGEINRSSGEKAGIIKSALNLQFGDAASAAASRTGMGLSDTLRYRRNNELAQILMEAGPDREGLLRAFAALGRSVRAKDVTGDVAQKLMQTIANGAQPVERQMLGSGRQ